MKNKKLISLIIIYILFLIITVGIKLDLTSSIDNLIHNAITFIFNDNIVKVMKIFTFFGSTAFIVSMCALYLIYKIIKNNYKVGVAACILLIISTIMNNVIKVIIKRARPVYMIVVENTYSYPSGHSMASMTLYGTIIYFIIKSNANKKTKIILTTLLSILILSVATSRIYLGAHFITDVVGGQLFSLSLIILFDILNDKYKFIS